MTRTWINIEQFFQNLGIKYEQKDWFYLCYIEGKQFYYSPQTGKWRMKGKRAWQFSQTPQDFINQAVKYLSTNKQNNQSSQTPNNPQKNNKKNSKKENKTNQKTYYSYTSNSSKQSSNSENTNEIRPEFLEIFGQYLKIQREKRYKIGWIWYSLLAQFVPTPKEICWLSVVFRYSPGWAFNEIKNIYGQANWEVILTLIENNQDNWLHYFQNRWKTENNEQHRREKQNHKVNEFNQQILTYESFLKTLKISFPFTKEELKNAYRKKALETHPDSGGTAEDFREVHTAYQILLSFSDVKLNA